MQIWEAGQGRTAPSQSESIKGCIQILTCCLLIWSWPAGLQAQQTDSSGNTPSTAQAQPEGPAGSRIAPGLEREQPDRRTLRNPYAGKGARDFPEPPDSAEGEDTDQTDSAAGSGIKPNAPAPPYPNYPESNLPRPTRSPRQQEYLYLNHLYFEPLTMAIGGFFSFGWLGMVGSGTALRLGVDIYNAGTNLSVILAGQAENDDYKVIGLLLRFGLHFFTERTQIKGFGLGIDLRSGIVIAPASGNALLIQAALELPFAYRFVLSFYSNSGRQALNLGFAPYVTFGIGGFLATSNTVSILRSTDDGLEEYLNNGTAYLEPSFINNIDPFALKIYIRVGFDVSFVF